MDIRDYKNLLYFNEPVLRTFSGKYINVLEPNPDDILLVDIAHSLSNICRFGGIVKSHYSIAEHSIWVSHNCDNKLEGLLHDASEAYLQDVPSPLKKLLPEYSKIEENFQRVISQKFNLKYPFPQDVLDADKMALEFEFQSFVLNDLNRNNKLSNNHNPEEDFLNRFLELK